MDAPRPTPPPTPPSPLGILGKVRLLWVVWTTAAAIVVRLRRERLPALVARLGEPAGRAEVPPALLSRAVSRGLRVGSWQPRCLIRALVLYRLLRAQGHDAVLVIGLADVRPTTEAHAWVELDGRDMGPAPGAFGHRALVRYPLDAVDHDRLV
jgi:hypothetical protein